MTVSCFRLLSVIVSLGLTEAHAQQCDTPFLGNAGDLDKVYVHELRGDGTLQDDSESLITESFLRLGVDVCLVRNVMCWATATEEATTCVLPNFLDRLDAGRMMEWQSKSAEDKDKLRSLVENESWLNMRGEFTIADDGFGILDFKSLEPEERWAFIKRHRHALSTMEWNPVNDRWESDSGRLKVTRIPEKTAPVLTSEERDFVYSAATSWANGMNWTDTIYTDKGAGTVTLQMDTINWGLICPEDIRRDECTRRVRSMLRLYVQDEFNVGDSGMLVPRLNFQASPLQRRLMEGYAAQLCGPVQSNLVQSLPIKGGNHFVADNILFIGTDDIVNFRRCDNWASSIGLVKEASTESIKNELTCEVAGSNGHGTVVVGFPVPEFPDTFDCNSSIAEGRHQPTYHIDIFFHPLGSVDSSGVKLFYYLLAEPYEQKCGLWSQEQDSIHTMLQVGIDSANKYLGTQLAGLQYKPRPVRIPLPVDFARGDSNPRFISLANCHSVKKGDAFEVYLSDYTDFVLSKFPCIDTVTYHEVVELAKKRLESTTRITVNSVKGQFTPLSGLHCHSKVIRRADN